MFPVYREEGRAGQAEASASATANGAFVMVWYSPLFPHPQFRLVEDFPKLQFLEMAPLFDTFSKFKQNGGDFPKPFPKLTGFLRRLWI